MKNKLKMAIGFGIALPIVSLVTLLGLEFNPDPVEKVSVQNMRPNEPAPSGKVLKLLSWNLQFSGSRKHHFFYDGGQTVHVPHSDVETTLTNHRLPQNTKPRFRLLQEVDRHSDRTGIPGSIGVSQSL